MKIGEYAEIHEQSRYVDDVDWIAVGSSDRRAREAWKLS